ncbi:MAG: uroporphyrinogen decarboxylase, partial [Hymenobacter sp.]
MLQNDILLRAAQGETTERTPVWLMRQAGRILPQYRELRGRLSGFKELVETPALAAEVTIQPVDALDVDAAIIFSDILVVPEAMGLTYEMIEAKGPLFPEVVKNAADVQKLRVADPHEHLGYVLEALRITKKELAGRVPLIGFAGAPWTILAYMVEGHGSKTFSKARRMLYQEPALAHQLLEKITVTTIAYLQAQVAAGADLVQVFDSWAGILPPAHYAEFSTRYISRICAALAPLVPVTIFAKGAWWAVEDLAKTPCRTIGLDWNQSPQQARQQAPGKTLQSNLDPCALYGTPAQVKAATEAMLAEIG